MLYVNKNVHDKIKKQLKEFDNDNLIEIRDFVNQQGLSFLIKLKSVIMVNFSLSMTMTIFCLVFVEAFIKQLVNTVLFQLIMIKVSLIHLLWILKMS